jgi:hypothetical protein
MLTEDYLRCINCDCLSKRVAHFHLNTAKSPNFLQKKFRNFRMKRLVDTELAIYMAALIISITNIVTTSQGEFTHKPNILYNGM